MTWITAQSPRMAAPDSPFRTPHSMLFTRLPRHIHLRTILIAVAVVAFLLAGGLWVAEMLRVRGRHLDRVALHTRGLQAIEFEAAKGRKRLQTRPGPAVEQAWERFVAGNRPWIAYHRRMLAKYRRAARYPWLPVPPDPPRPE